MKKETLLALASAVAAFEAFITELANNECGGTETTAPENPSTGTPEPAQPAKRRGRPPGTSQPPGDPPADPAPPQEPPKPEKPTGLTPEQLEENYQRLRKIIEPFVKGTWTKPPEPKGPDVRKILNKYKPEGWEGGDYTTKELANHPEHFAAFEKDIEALGY